VVFFCAQVRYTGGMAIHLFTTGKLKDAAYATAEAEYLKRLVVPWTITITELATAATPTAEAKTQSAALAKLGPRIQVMLLDEHGPQPTSPALAQQLHSALCAGPLALLIGGAAGFDAAFKAAHPLHLSLSKLTLPHQLVRVVLAEQLYRCQSIVAGHPYHRGVPN
jgi:23S rRNA (pseudouridine1915-N3)-methyltransferase